MITSNALMKQRKVIDNLNDYLAWHHLPIRLNKSGVCNGLASLYIKYYLEGKQDDFEQIVTQIARMTSNVEMNSEVNHFAAEVVRTFSPGFFDKDKTLYNAISELQIDQKPLKSSFDIGMVASAQHWTSIFKEIALREDECMLLRSGNHAVSLSKKDNKYVVYDPNYDYGFKLFASEEQLMKELQSNVFAYSGPIGMSVQVIRHPSKGPRKFPDVSKLYEKYLDPKQIAKFKGVLAFDQLRFLLPFDNTKAIDLLFQRGYENKNRLQSACEAILLNNKAMLGYLLTKLPANEHDLSALFQTALDNGFKNSFDELLHNERCKSYYENNVLKQENATRTINYAASGGNVELLQALFNDYQTKGKPQPLNDLTIVERIRGRTSLHRGDAIHQAINSTSVSCVRLLLDKINNTPCQPNEEQTLSYLLYAISKNQPLMVEFFQGKIMPL